MSRVNIYEQISTDDWDGTRDDSGSGPALLGWFDTAKAVSWTDRDCNGNGSGGTGCGQSVWRTAGGKWVLQNWSAWQNEESTFAYITADQARDWLLRNEEDAAVAGYFGPVAEEEDRRPGRPAIGEAVNVRLGDLLGRVDQFGREGGMRQEKPVSRAEAIRELVLAALIRADAKKNASPESMGDAMEDGAAKMAAMLAERPASLDPRALFLSMSRTMDAVRQAADQLRKQGWLDLDESRGVDAEAAARLSGALESLNAASAMFDEIANGWI